jgi:hypothetical protein
MAVLSALAPKPIFGNLIALGLTRMRESDSLLLLSGVGARIYPGLYMGQMDGEVDARTIGSLADSPASVETHAIQVQRKPPP